MRTLFQAVFDGPAILVVDDEDRVSFGFSFFLEGPKGSALDGYIWTNDTLRSSGMVGVTGWADRPDDVIFNASLPVRRGR